MPPIEVVSYTIYHSPNAYLGMVLAERRLAGLPVIVRRRPIVIPRARGVKVADLVGGREAAVHGAYHREDCRRWALQHGIELHFLPPGVFEQRAQRWRESAFDREELPARAYYAAVGSGREARLDRALFEAAWVQQLDVNDEAVVRQAIATAGLDADELLQRALQPEAKRQVDEALAAFDRDACPGVPTWVVNGERFWGKDRVDWLARRVEALLASGADAPVV
jgi:2-hydroxychromene-2-carboxylate isomerase